MRVPLWLALVLASTASIVAAANSAAPASAAPAGVGCDLAAADARAAGSGCARAWMDANLRLNDIVAMGTHNSYKQRQSAAEFALIAARNPQAAQSIDYGHRPLAEQLDAGARQLEIDVYYDPAGGRFAAPLGPTLTGQTLPADYAATMSGPGFKVFHIPDIDPHSSCLLFVDCLRRIKTWSDAHPDHAPILITMNTKQDASPVPGGTGALPMTEDAFDALDREIRSVLPPAKLITPDDVQGAYPSLRAAVLADNWPTLGASRGRILFALDEPPGVVAVYRGRRHALEGRVLFVNTDESSPAAAYLTLNEPQELAARIAAAVDAGFLVRTRADADTVEARANSTDRRDAALAGGAQYVSTDYLWPDTRFSPYTARLPGAAKALCNPRRAAARCQGLPVE